MSKYLPEISPELETAFMVFRAECTERAAMTYVTPVFGIRAAFRAWIRDNDLPIGKPSDLQVNWLLDDANVPLETLPSRQGPRMLHACGIRLTAGVTK
ncbi:hypothetical protein ACF1A5_09900 [Streptomyces sp. NPDC014864]|uniref:hypothetical protein n=1 Tax=Streptomyces sp. NPDC014864 TaxID=3364924 RepID=UPI0036FB7643